MPHCKSGYWVRVFIGACDLETACKAPLRPHRYGDAPECNGARVKPVEGVVVEDVEVEHEHTSVFDDEGREIERYNAEGKLIEPCDSSEEEGNSYTNAGLHHWMVELLARQAKKGDE